MFDAFHGQDLDPIPVVKKKRKAATLTKKAVTARNLSKTALQLMIPCYALV